MRADNWKIYDKKGSNLNTFIDSYLNLTFETDVQNALGAEAYAITDPSGIITDVAVINSGWEYDPNTEVRLTYTFGEYDQILTSAEASISFIDVSIYNPDPNNSYGIGSVLLDVSTEFIYPSSVYSGAIFLDPVSIQLVETEHLSILEETSTGEYIRPFDEENPTLVFRFSDGDSEIKLFELDDDTQTIVWSEELIFDVSVHVELSPLMVNIGFRSEEEGVYERKLRIYHKIEGIDYQLAEIIVNAQSIGPDERFDTLAQDLGLPNAKNFPHLFKSANINEAMPDWQLLNYKGKHMVLDHAQITPYIGSYKALINAIKWLGYEDIKVKEWFRNVKENKKLSLYVPYDAEERTKTILYFSPEERKNLKKLNQLSLVYCITRETGEIDEFGNPLVEECYEYNINEILTKLKALKDWLEKNIIGVNARITDVTGEGVYFERFRNIIYSTQDKGTRAIYEKSLSPITMDKSSELIAGDASIRLSLLEITNTQSKELSGLRLGDFLDYYWDPSNGAFDPEDASLLWWDPSTLYVGAPFKYPLYDMNSIQWRASVEKTESGVLGPEFVTNPLWIYDNEIRFYDILDSSSIFFDSSTNLAILLEEGFLRDSSNDNWEDSIAYSYYPNYFFFIDASKSKTLTYDSSYAIIDGSGIIYNNPKLDSSGFIYDSDSSIIFNPSVNPTYFIVDGDSIIITNTSTKIQSPLQEGYAMESSTGSIWYTESFINLRPTIGSKLEYAFDNNYKAPLLKFTNYRFMDSSENYIDFGGKEYTLDILDGKIRMTSFIAEPSSLFNDPSIYRKEEYYINWNYDTSIDEQKITLNVVYSSPIAPVYLYDPSTYYFSGESSALLIDNSIYIMHVNHIGPYHIEVFGWDGQNIVYKNAIEEDYKVWTKFPRIWSYLDTSCGYNPNPILCPSAYLTAEDVSALIAANIYPIFDRQIPLQGLTLEQDINDEYYINVPSISYFVDNPDPGSLSRFYNMTERVVERSGDTFTVDPDYQWFNIGDYVNLVLFDRGQYYFIEEVSGYISADVSNGSFIDLTISDISTNFVTNSFTEVYLLNDTRREVYQAINDLNNQTVEVDISTGGSSYYHENQLVGIIIDDVCTGYSWGSSFRVLDVSLNPDPSLYFEGIYHKLRGNIPEFILADPLRYELTAKHAFSTFSDFTIEIDHSTEVNNNFQIYLNDIYYHQYYLDNTFVYVNVLFDQEAVLDQWFDPSTDLGLITGPFYPYAKSITIDPSTLVILDAFYDPSNYMLNQKNLWTVKNHDTQDIIFRVYNKQIPYIFNEAGTYDVQVEAYDFHGNLKLQFFEGLIVVSDE
jgi:hypothetical protein